MKEIATMAQDFVEATSALVGHRTINIMDTNAIIVASTEKNRIGTFHQGAAEVLATGKPVLVRKENLAAYPGAREGYNMPIYLDDEMIGVVGMFGDEAEVRDTANLLCVYVSQQFAQFQMAQKQKMESEIGTQLLRSLLLGDETQREKVQQLCDFLDVHLSFPYRVILIYTETAESTDEYVESLSHAVQSLVWKGILDRQRDVFGFYKQSYVILLGDDREKSDGEMPVHEHSGRDDTEAEPHEGDIGRLSGREQPDERNGQNRIGKLIAEIRSHPGWRTVISGICKTMNEIPEGMREVMIMKEMKGGEIQNLEEHSCRMRYLLGRFISYGGDRAVREMKERLLQEGEKQAELLLSTAECYYEENGSATRASERLHLHKNSLLYRMKRLYQLLGIEEDTAFVREFYVRLLLEYWNQNF